MSNLSNTPAGAPSSVESNHLSALACVQLLEDLLPQPLVSTTTTDMFSSRQEGQCVEALNQVAESIVDGIVPPPPTPLIESGMALNADLNAGAQSMDDGGGPSHLTSMNTAVNASLSSYPASQGPSSNMNEMDKRNQLRAMYLAGFQAAANAHNHQLTLKANFDAALYSHSPCTVGSDHSVSGSIRGAGAAAAAVATDTHASTAPGRDFIHTMESLSVHSPTIGPMKPPPMTLLSSTQFMQHSHTINTSGAPSIVTSSSIQPQSDFLDVQNHTLPFSSSHDASSTPTRSHPGIATRSSTRTHHISHSGNMISTTAKTNVLAPPPHRLLSRSLSTPSVSRYSDVPVESLDTTGSNDFDDDEDDDAFMDSPHDGSCTGGLSSSSLSPKKKRDNNGGGGGGSNPFPRKLMEMLDNEDSSVVYWLPQCDAFKIRDHETFVAEILPKYFRHRKFTSFQRQLNLYGFRRITKGPDTGAYRHDMFRRNRPELCTQMKRSKQKSGTPSPKLRSNSISSRTSSPAVTSVDHLNSSSSVMEQGSFDHMDDFVLFSLDGAGASTSMGSTSMLSQSAPASATASDAYMARTFIAGKDINTTTTTFRSPLSNMALLPPIASLKKQQSFVSVNDSMSSKPQTALSLLSARETQEMVNKEHSGLSLQMMSNANFKTPSNTGTTLMRPQTPQFVNMTEEQMKLMQRDIMDRDRQARSLAHAGMLAESVKAKYQEGNRTLEIPPYLTADADFGWSAMELVDHVDDLDVDFLNIFDPMQEVMTMTFDKNGWSGSSTSS